MLYAHFLHLYFCQSLHTLQCDLSTLELCGVYAACLMSADSETSAASGSSASTTSPQSFSLLQRAVIILFYERIHRKIGSRNR